MRCLELRHVSGGDDVLELHSRLTQKRRERKEEEEEVVKVL